jgi:hypothetical protein
MAKKDFTLCTYRSLISALQEQGYQFQTVSDFSQNPAERVVMLRHDVDLRKYNSLVFAKIQHEHGIVGTYYFRIIPASYNRDLIQTIYGMGHEIGYHYEDLHLANGDPNKAIKLFEDHLKKLRKLVPIRSICMHGSPLSKHDNREIWNHFRYQEFDVTVEPYFDIDFKKVFYLTDTSRRWNGYRFSVRDKVENNFGLFFQSTHEIIECLSAQKFPPQVMFNFHPQRWTDNNFLWWEDAIVQSVKNSAKYVLIKWRENSRRTPQVSGQRTF